MAIHRYWILSGLTAAGVLSFWMHHQREVQGRGAYLTPPTSTTHSLDVSWNPTRKIKDASSAQGKSTPVTQPPESIRQKLKTAKDYYALAKEILPLAKAGNPEAQYGLYVTSGQCRHALGAKAESLAAARDEAMRVFAKAPDPAEFVSLHETGYIQCHGFFTANAESMGDPLDWLQKATAAGYPMAQAATAGERFSQDAAKAAKLAGGSPDDPRLNLPPIGGDAIPHDLLVAAVKSGDPDVLLAIGQLQLMLNPTLPRDVMQLNSIAWLYTACQRGADCSEFGPGTVTNCGPNDGNCAPVPNRFLGWVNHNWAPVQERVNQINAALAAKQWDQLPGLAAGG